MPRRRYRLRPPDSPKHTGKAVLVTAFPFGRCAVCNGRKGKDRHLAVFSFTLFLRFLVYDALAERRVVFLELNFALNFLLILAAEIGMVRLRGLQLYEAVL